MCVFQKHKVQCKLKQTLRSCNSVETEARKMYPETLMILETKKIPKKRNYFRLFCDEITLIECDILFHSTIPIYDTIHSNFFSKMFYLIKVETNNNNDDL